MLAFDPGPSGLVRPLDLPANRVGLAKQVEDVLRRTVVVPLSDRQSDASATTPGALLITGPPASGKSAAVAWLASQLEGVATTLVLHPRVLSSADFLHLAFDMAADATPSLLVLDNLDLILGDRFSMRYPESLAELATRLDDLLGYRQVVVVATAVQAEPLDALLHARFPNRLQLGEAPKSQRIEMLKALVERHGGDGAIIEVLARRTQHWRVGKIADLARLADATAAAGGSVDLVHLVDQVQKPVLAQDSDDSDGTYL